MKRWAALLTVLLLCSIWVCADADREAPVKGKGYIGAMRVVKVKEWVSLREGPRKTEKRIMQVPLGAIVYGCTEDIKHFVKCEYEGTEGYILLQYLERAPEYEPAETTAHSVLMTREEVVEHGEVILDWKDYNVEVIASHEVITENKMEKEVLRVGCFIDDEPNWGHVETAEKRSQTDMLKAFIGGSRDDPQVLIHDGEYGLCMIDMLMGNEKWMLLKRDCDIGNAEITAVGTNGMMVFASADQPDPKAVSVDGSVLWMTDLDNPDIYDPFEIVLGLDSIDIKYRSGSDKGYILVSLDYDGEIIDTEEKGAA